jgi:hypothetical protein
LHWLFSHGIIFNALLRFGSIDRGTILRIADAVLTMRAKIAAMVVWRASDDNDGGNTG